MPNTETKSQSFVFNNQKAIKLSNYVKTLQKKSYQMADLYMNYLEEEMFIKCMNKQSFNSSNKNNPCTLEAQKWSRYQQKPFNQLKSSAASIISFSFIQKKRESTLMGCTQAKQIGDSNEIKIEKISNEQQEKPYIGKNNNSLIGLEENQLNLKDWEEFSQRDDAIKILSKEQLSSLDFQFLLRNQIWKVQWLESVCQKLQINLNKGKQFQLQIMTLFLRVMLKQSRFMQNEDKYQVLCEICYKKQLQRFLIDRQLVDEVLFQKCNKCSGIGWIQIEQTEEQGVDIINCSLCKQIVKSFKIEAECKSCSTLGQKWKK